MEPRSRRSSADWRRAAAGIELVGISVFLLLNSLGVLPWSFWLDALRLWPLAIMAMGVRIAFERSRTPWLLLLRPVIVLGALTWVARGTLPQGPPPEWTPLCAARPADIRSVRFEAALPGALLDLATRPLAKDVLVEGRSASSRRTSRLETGRLGDAGHVLVRVAIPQGLVLPTARVDRFDLALPSDLPLDLRLSGAMIRGHLDLSSGDVEAASTKGAFCDLEIRLPRPERTVPVEVRGVLNVVKLLVPAGTPVRVRGPGLPFNVRDRGRNGTPSAERPGYEVRIRGVFNAVTVGNETNRPLPEQEPGGDGKAG
jgi:hypothetical protein